jgi:hypothetical protein
MLTDGGRNERIQVLSAITLPSEFMDALSTVMTEPELLRLRMAFSFLMGMVMCSF